MNSKIIVNFVMLGIFFLSKTKRHWQILVFVMFGLAASPGYAKCIQAGYLPGEGAIDCRPATIVVDEYWGSGFQSTSDRAVIEAAALAYLNRPCRFLVEVIQEWTPSSWGSQGIDEQSRATGARSWWKKYKSTGMASPSGGCDPSPNNFDFLSLNRTQIAKCPPNVVSTAFLEKEGGDGSMMCGYPLVVQNTCTLRGNPIDVVHAAKVQTEPQLYTAEFYFAWHYSSDRRRSTGGSPPVPASDHPLLGYQGRVWQHSFEKKIIFSGTGIRPVVRLIRPAATQDIYFIQNAGTWVRIGGGQGTLVEVAGGQDVRWQYRTENDDDEHYDAGGRLTKIVARGGRAYKLLYTNGLLSEVLGPTGRSLTFLYDKNRMLASMTDSAGNVFKYIFDSVAETLLQVSFPGGGSRSYSYDPVYRHLLTGITDENGIAYSTYTYDAGQKAASTSQKGDVNSYQIKGHPYSRKVEITNPLGSTETLNFNFYDGTLWLVGQSQPSGAGCAASASKIDYDDNGNVSMREDFNGSVTKYPSYDLTRNLETKRIEAADTPDARTITTQWHPSYHLPVKIFEPNRVTKFAYDSDGNLLEKSVQATKDTTGAQEAAAVVTGPIQTWKYAYNTIGQILTLDGPRTDVNDVTTYTYDDKGNLATVKNALEQTTVYSNYDANGRVGRIEHPNKLIEEFTYTPRGWLETRTVGGQQWRYDYDGVGQLKRLQSPDGTAVSYTYDDAHRLVKVTDTLGNSITYTLDNMGNRVAEEVKDLTGTLTRKVSRDFDNMNLLKQQTGGAL